MLLMILVYVQWIMFSLFVVLLYICPSSYLISSSYTLKYINWNGPLAIKIIQIACSQLCSTDQNYKPLLSLLDHVPAHSIAHTCNVLRSAGILGDIAYIDHEPLGSGSMAQVHRCQLVDDPHMYVVKVLHPNALRLEMDLSVVENIIYFVLMLAGSNIICLDEFVEGIRSQSDLRIEAANMIQFGKSVAATHSNLVVPMVCRYGSEYLIMSYIQARPLHTLTLSQQTDIVIQAMAVLIMSSLPNGITHGDMHAGNILCTTQGKLVLLDFGMCFYSDNSGTSSIFELIMKLHPVPSHMSVCNFLTHIYQNQDDAQVDADALLYDLKNRTTSVDIHHAILLFLRRRNRRMRSHAFAVLLQFEQLDAYFMRHPGQYHHDILGCAMKVVHETYTLFKCAQKHIPECAMLCTHLVS